MKIGIITSPFMKGFIGQIIAEMKPEFSYEMLIYHSCKDVASVYTAHEDDFDGFLISGPIPKKVVETTVQVKKPLKDVGTDLQSYYETFLSIIFQYGTDFHQGYFDLLDWVGEKVDLGEMLKLKRFDQLQRKMQQFVATMTAEEIMAKEEEIFKKHISLWKEGRIAYSCTRFSSILEEVRAAGVNCFFVYPHQQVVRSAVELLCKEIDLSRLKDNRTCAIALKVREGDGSKEQQRKLEEVVNRINKSWMGNFRITAEQDYILVLLGHKMVCQLTDGMNNCRLKSEIQQLLPHEVSIGYGIGTDLKDAVCHSRQALTESMINMQGDSYLINEKGDILGPLYQGKGLQIRGKITPEIIRLSEKVKLSTLTVQKLMTALDRIGREEVTPKGLAEILNITTRSANRFIGNLIDYGEGRLLYERQSGSRGRPVRVYGLGLEEGKDFE